VEEGNAASHVLDFVTGWGSAGNNAEWCRRLNWGAGRLERPVVVMAYEFLSSAG